LLIPAACLLETLAWNGRIIMNIFSFRRRVFLASVSTGLTSYVFAEVESSNGGEYRYGHYMLSLADCRRRIELEFSLATSRARRESLAKLDLLIEVLSSFREALATEAQLIAGYDKTEKPTRTKRHKA
jgi:hypothetical protein